MNESHTMMELAKALSKAQAEMPAAVLNAFNPFFKTQYADLGSIISTSKPVLAKHGLAVSQLTTSCDGDVGLTTILMHESGEWIRSTITLPIGSEAKNVAQAAGAIITYLRRYSYASILGIYADEDTDGEDAPQTTPAKTTKKAKKTKEAQPQSGKVLMDIAKAEAITNSKGVKYGDLTTEQLSHMYTAITKSTREAAADGVSVGWDEDLEDLVIRSGAIESIMDARK